MMGSKSINWCDACGKITNKLTGWIAGTSSEMFTTSRQGAATVVDLTTID